ncbi:hypothetical protein GJAV_G00199810 [Gymnothorax javanicus]|nr:hypothetical protein GJAV_G00199810 [Gymnothorax javanicus]
MRTFLRIPEIPPPESWPGSRLTAEITFLEGRGEDGTCGFRCIPGYALSAAGPWENKDSQLLHQDRVTQFPSPAPLGPGRLRRKLPETAILADAPWDSTLVLLKEGDGPEEHTVYPASVGYSGLSPPTQTVAAASESERAQPRRAKWTVRGRVTAGDGRDEGGAFRVTALWGSPETAPRCNRGGAKPCGRPRLGCCDRETGQK